MINIIPMPPIPHHTRKAEFAKWQAKKCGAYIDSSRFITERTIVCTICKTKKIIPIADQFTAYSELYTDKNGYTRTKILKANKMAMQWFVDRHFESCIKWYGIPKEERLST